MIKVLFVTYDFPYPLNSGGKNRAFNMMKYAKDKDISIDLLSFVREGFDLKNIEELEKIDVGDIYIYPRKKLKSVNTIGRNLISSGSIFKTLYFDKSFKKLLKKIIVEKNIDIVHFESSYTGYYIGEELKKLGVFQILGTENIESLLYEEFLKNSKNLIKKAALSYQVKRFKKEEEKMMKKADLCIAVTKDEANYISKISGKEVGVVENAVSIKDFKFEFNSKSNGRILFVGNFTYMPNVAALKYFLNNVMPILDKKIKLTVIGRRVKEFVTEDERIEALEYVKDLISEYRKSDLMVFPIKIGGGTNYKILEAMALGIPIVAFPDKVNSIGAKENTDYFKVENEKEFAKKIEFVINNKKACSDIVKSARKLIEERYSWEKVGVKLSGIWRKSGI
jgi:glycosyltransferase involved in cell wall biosynthesis